MELIVLAGIYLAALIAAYLLGRAGIQELPRQEKNAQRKHAKLALRGRLKTTAANDDCDSLDQAS